jgi:sarcosine oxidase
VTAAPCAALVVGAGVNGLAAAWNLLLLGAAPVVVVERFRGAHDRGSSHGASRITRTSYHDRRYALLAMEAQREDWPRLERDSGRTFVTPAPGLFFGPADGTVRAYADAVVAAGAPVDRIDAAEARRRFPQFRFDGEPMVLVDSSAGVLAAADVLVALRQGILRLGGRIVEDAEVVSLGGPGDGAVAVATTAGDFAAERVIVTAGAWTARLVPRLATRLSVVRQSVCYLAPGGPDAAAFRAPRFPVWVWLGHDEHEHWYGLPEFGRPGITAAKHATGSGDDDPDDAARPASPADVDEVVAFLARELAVPVRGVIATERCLYTNTATQDFVLGPLPGDPRIIVGAACSGHAFKFAPLTGRVLAEMALRGRTTSPAFEAARASLAV